MFYLRKMDYYCFRRFEFEEDVKYLLNRFWMLIFVT